MSQWHAVDALDEALSRTKSLLFPFRWGVWLRLALVVMLAGGLGGGNGGRAADYADQTKDISPEVVYLIVAVVAAVLFVGLVFWYVSSVFRFVLVKSLLRGRADIMDDAKEQAGNGLSLFIFEFGVFLAVVAVIVAAVAAAVMLSTGEPSIILTFALIVAAVIAFVALVVAVSVLFWLLNDFAVPIMYSRGCGIMAALREAVSVVSSNFWQACVYILLALALGIVAAIPIFIISFVLFFIVFLGLFVLGGAAYVALIAVGETTLSPVVVFLAVVGLALALAALLLVGYVVTFITLPVSVFFRYYSLIFLSRIDPSLRLMGPEKAEDAGTDDSSKDLLDDVDDDIESFVKVY